MKKIVCSRCKKEAAALPAAPLPNELGNKLLKQTCQACWQAWVSQQLMLMNEYRLDPLDNEHNRFLDDEMVKFLELT